MYGLLIAIGRQKDPSWGRLRIFLSSFRVRAVQRRRPAFKKGPTSVFDCRWRVVLESARAPVYGPSACEPSGLKRQTTRLSSIRHLVEDTDCGISSLPHDR
jgi:hypothetical protein